MTQVYFFTNNAEHAQSLRLLLPEAMLTVLVPSQLDDQASDLFSTDAAVILDEEILVGEFLKTIRKLRVRKPNQKQMLCSFSSTLPNLPISELQEFEDFITNEMRSEEIQLRLNLLIARQTRHQLRQQIQIGGLEIDLNTREVKCDGKQLKLAKKEFDLLKVLAENPNRVFTREELMQAVWGVHGYDSQRTVDTHILFLRKKLSVNFIESVRGVGYLFRNQNEDVGSTVN